MKRTPAVLLLLVSGALLQAQHPANADLVRAGRRQFEVRCAGCHGADGMGGERAPAIGAVDRQMYRNERALRELIRKGIPDAGMPGFDVRDAELAALVAFVHSRISPARDTAVPGDRASGQAFFFGTGKCVECHMISGRGGLDGPDLTNAGEDLTLAEMEQALLHPEARRHGGYRVVTVRPRSGEAVRGFLRNQSDYDLQVQGFDHRWHFFRRDELQSMEFSDKPLMPPVHASEQELQDLIAYLIRPAEGPRLPAAAEQNADAWKEIVEPRSGDWPTYHGNIGGNRYSTLSQITPANVGALAVRWLFTLPDAGHLEVTPVVVDGVMYVTNVNEMFALDAASGRQIWHYARPRSEHLVGDAAGGINRGVAVLGDRVFMVTDNCHLIALHRLTGALLWDTEMADSKEQYGATSAPLVVHDLVISGTSGGDEGIRGFVAAYKASTGERIWRFWTVPLPGEPLAKTWQGRALEHGCTSAWLTGTYDVENNLLFWTTGNPCPDFNGDERRGDNLYSDSVLALQPETGALKWYFQFTPHDLHDWDSSETPMVVDAQYHGERRKLLLHGDRNGFFYVLDRTNGHFLSASPFLRRLTWASGIGADGRPIPIPGAEPTRDGALVCPSMDGATNWMSTAFHPGTGLFYLMVLEKCSIFTKSSAWWRLGDSFYGGAARNEPGASPLKVLRAMDIQTGRIAWEYPQIGHAETWGGILATSTGLVFFGEDSGAFAALDATTGRPLWHLQLNAEWKASPMTYLAQGKQYVCIAAAGSLVAMALP